MKLLKFYVLQCVSKSARLQNLRRLIKCSVANKRSAAGWVAFNCISYLNKMRSRECVSMGAAGARTRRSLGHHLMHPLILRLLLLCAPVILRSRALFYRTDCTRRQGSINGFCSDITYSEQVLIFCPNSDWKSISKCFEAHTTEVG